MKRRILEWFAYSWIAHKLGMEAETKHAQGECWCQKKALVKAYKNAKCKSRHDDGTHCSPSRIGNDYVCYHRCWRPAELHEDRKGYGW